jgi:N-acetylmuramoyl-L-alanine amidase
VFGDGTRAALVDFQRRRGLHSNGVCDDATWLALVEAGWSLGDRLLMLGAPQQRGDDVAELQDALNQLGFDCGRPDGIFGPATARALEDFQRNSGLVVDGVCGPLSLRMIGVLRRQTGDGPGVATVRERTGRPGAHASLRVVVGQFGGLSTIARSVTRSLRLDGATVMSTDEYEPAAQAAAANRFGATVYVGFEPVADERSMVSYFAVPTFESVGGRALAGMIARNLHQVRLRQPIELLGMRLPVLRETRMPAVLCSLGPVRDVVDAAEPITDAVVTALSEWSASNIASA